MSRYIMSNHSLSVEEQTKLDSEIEYTSNLFIKYIEAFFKYKKDKPISQKLIDQSINFVKDHLEKDVNVRFIKFAGPKTICYDLIIVKPDYATVGNHIIFDIVTLFGVIHL